MTKQEIKTYQLPHYANKHKEEQLWSLYYVYKKEYSFHIKRYWSLYKSNKISKFTHLGSTKEINTKLNSAYLQGCLAQSCASLNNYLANIETKFKELLVNIKDKDLLHQLRTINKNHTWIATSDIELVYYPLITKVDDHGNSYTVKQKVIISKEALILAKRIFKHIIKHRVSFPNIKNPRLILDSRVVKYSKNNSSRFDSWLKISTLEKGKTVSLPLKTYAYFNQAQGVLANSFELSFKTYPYNIKNKNNKNKEIKIYAYKKYNNSINNINTNIIKHKIIGIDLGLSTFIATSNGELLGQCWLEKLKKYDKKITDLAKKRQKLKLRTRSKRYDCYIQQLKGFIKSETNRVLNHYFHKNQDISTVVIERLNLNNPTLSKRLNRIIKNFGLKLFKAKLAELSKEYGFSVEEVNPAYTSQECSKCGYVSTSNRQKQKEFSCKCCGSKQHADVQAGKVLVKRFHYNILNNINFTNVSKQAILQLLKERFNQSINTLILSGATTKQKINKLAKANPLFFASEAKGFSL